MKLDDLTTGVKTWCSNEERAVLEGICELRAMASFEERDQTIIENLIRKNLLIKVQGKHSTYVYPNV